MRNKTYSDYTASSQVELLCYLKQQDVTVPQEGRLSQHCEKREVFRLLATWAASDCFSYPLRLVHQDRPDFLLCYGGREVGIEFTEAVSEERAATKALAKQMGKPLPLSIDLFKRGTKRTGKERRELIEENPIGEGSVDDEPEDEWALSIKDCVLAKTKAFNRPDFKKYSTNWLLIYDNLPLEDLEIETSMKFFIKYMNDYWLRHGRYDGLLIDTRDQLIEVNSAGKWSRQKVFKPWAQQNEVNSENVL